MTTLESILDLARWAPSGDNTQPWRFEVLSERHVVVHGFDTRERCVYDFEGRASQLSLGALLETLRIAATGHGLAARFVRRQPGPETEPVFDVWLEDAQALKVDPLIAQVTRRSVQRKPFSRRALSPADKAALDDSVGAAHRVVWLEGSARRRMAWMATRSAKIRLTIPEAYAVHREIIDWGKQFSDDRVPDQALGSDPITLRFMRWVMASWDRVQMMNRFFAGTVAPRIQLDLLPGLLCAAHFAIVGQGPSQGIDDQIAAGAVVQRFWLTATALGLQLQPQYTPLVFAAYARRQIGFTRVASALRRAAETEKALGRLLGASVAGAAVFMGRVGYSAPPRARSLRLSLEQLRWAPSPQNGRRSST